MLQLVTGPEYILRQNDKLFVQGNNLFSVGQSLLTALEQATYGFKWNSN